MFRLGIDENVPRALVRGLLQRFPDLDLLRAQDAGLLSASDPAILEWCASEGRILVTFDRATMSDHAADRIRRGQVMPGVFLLAERLHQRIGLALEALALPIEASQAEEWRNQVVYLPF